MKKISNPEQRDAIKVIEECYRDDKRICPVCGLGEEFWNSHCVTYWMLAQEKNDPK